MLGPVDDRVTQVLSVVSLLIVAVLAWWKFKANRHIAKLNTKHDKRRKELDQRLKKGEPKGPWDA